MLDNFKKYQVENQEQITGGKNIIVDPECFRNEGN